MTIENSVMERERKRKRAAADGGGRRTTEDQADDKKVKEKVIVQSPPPTEAEVEEFFAILRRMHVAVKYFEKTNVGLDGPKFTERLETEVLPIVGVEDDEDDGVKEVGNGDGNSNGGLDLNRMPEGESSSV